MAPNLACLYHSDQATGYAIFCRDDALIATIGLDLAGLLAAAISDFSGGD